jgi:hypothetical protein
MRARFLGAFALTALLTGPAVAQVQQNNPNAANESFNIQNQFRSLQQQQTTNYNILNMQAQRNVQFAPPPAPVVLPRHGSTHGLRAPRAGGGLNTSICTGC